ncbi:Protein PLASTID MOVEMENT IMPAIRED 1-RELATED 1 [Rhynchospora pubera]|uniref:Protein PLASTID MOVEMENT IMPAIRED 1-RELATED 1 n=1 Tax=Rhynchospora pubera TaxID=906938 RepID=A0AAV8DWQ4_9POAL|nr:Protein PLASTID MOVEMENT IMPAIRED 1-RELATED 1 [Rhynchospora pubera]
MHARHPPCFSLVKQTNSAPTQIRGNLTRTSFHCTVGPTHHTTFLLFPSMAGKPLSSKTTSTTSASSSSSSSGDARFLHDIETLSKALSLNPPSKSRLNPSRRSLPPPPSAARSNSGSNPTSKGSIWRSLKSLSHLGQRRLDCVFSLHVKSIESLPSSLEGSSLSVHFHPSSSSSSTTLSTRPVKASRGLAQFDETLNYRSTIYVKSSVYKTHAAKYEARQFSIHVTCAGTDLGRHTIDLTRLLPLTIAELEAESKIEEEEGEGEEKGKWSTSFRLTGRAHGGKLNVSFGYSLIGSGENRERKIGEILNDKHARIEKEKALPSFVRNRNRTRAIEEVKMLHELLPFVKPVVSGLSTKMETEKECENGEVDTGMKQCELHGESDVGKKEAVDESSPEPKYCTSVEPKNQMEMQISVDNNTDFTVIEQGIEIETKDQEEKDSTAEGSVQNDRDLKENQTTQESEESVLEELESIFENLSFLEYPNLEENNKLHSSLTQEDVDPSFTSPNLKRSHSFDAVTESVASEFLTMLGLDHSPFGQGSDSEPDPDSPREQLLRQFEKESLATGSGLLGLDYEEDSIETEDEGIRIEDSLEKDVENGISIEENDLGFDFTSLIQEAELEMPISKAKLLEDAETEVLMRKFGLDENSFYNSPPAGTGKGAGFGSPIHLPPDDPIELPPLLEGVGPFVQTKSGGFLRSMNPDLFKNSKTGGSLVMQASSPIVVPAEMGGGIMDILQKLASVGIEKLSRQASKLMPLEEITGTTMQQLICEAGPCLEESYNRSSSKRRKRKGIDSAASTGGKVASSSEYVSLEDLAPLAMEKIEALSIEGLRIQSGMSDEEAPSNITPQSIGDISALEGKISQNALSLGLEGTAGLQLLDVKSKEVEDVDGLMGLSLTLDEWMKLDSGLIEDEGEITDRTAKILAAHHANSVNLVHDGQKKSKRGRRWGLLGNNFTVAIMVQLRDPLRNFEPVGAPMLALIQVERVFIPPKPKVYGNVSLKVDTETDEENKTEKKELVTEEIKVVEEGEVASISQYKINEVHVAGFKTEPEPVPDKKNPWSNGLQQQSGSRWLIAAGMGKGNKHPLLNSKVGNSSNAKPGKGDSLWSISSRVQGNGSKRNPNILLSNKTGRIR